MKNSLKNIENVKKKKTVKINGIWNVQLQVFIRENSIPKSRSKKLAISLGHIMVPFPSAFYESTHPIHG